MLTLFALNQVKFKRDECTVQKKTECMVLNGITQAILLIQFQGYTKVQFLKARGISTKNIASPC